MSCSVHERHRYGEGLFWGLNQNGFAQCSGQGGARDVSLCCPFSFPPPIGIGLVLLFDFTVSKSSKVFSPQSPNLKTLCLFKRSVV